jgi:hypothetical protein
MQKVKYDALLNNPMIGYSTIVNLMRVVLGAR